MRLRDLSSHGKLTVRGKDRVRFLNGLFTNDVAKLKPGGGCRAAMLTVKAKLLGDVLLLADEDAVHLDLDGTIKDKIRDQMEKHLIVDDVEITDQSADLDEVGVYGDDARAGIEGLLGPLPDLLPWSHVTVGGTRVVRVNELGQVGYRLIGNAMALASKLGAPWLDEAQAEILRVEAGEPRYGVDMGEDQLPIEARLDDLICHTKGCYMGQEPIARANARGHINRKLMGLRLDGQGAASRGAKVSSPERADTGYVTSSVVSPRLGPIALAYVHRSAWAPGTALEVLDGDTRRRAEVCELPFPGQAA